MPLFISDAELEQVAGDVSVVVQRADAYVQELHQQVETYKARADAAAISAEQNCALIEQKFLSLTAQFTQAENEKTHLDAALHRRSTELAQAQAQAHKLELESIKKDSDAERSTFELSELRKAKRELVEVVEQKNIELNEKNASIKVYLDKIVSLTNDRSVLEGKLHENEAEVVRIQVVQARLSQEKELLEQHNAWLNEELTCKVNSLLEERRTNAESEVELRSKLLEAERLGKETAERLQRSREQVKDLELKFNQTREELIFTKDDADAKEKHFETEVATATKLADLYKQSSEEWSKKAIELEGVVKALEAHLNQVDSELRKKLEEAIKVCEASEKEAAETREKLEKTVKELEASKIDRESDCLSLVKRPYDSLTGSIDQELALEIHGVGPLPPALSPGISATAFAAALLRDGWTMTRIYMKYQEAVDAWRHERQERKHCQTLLERVLHEIEEKAEFIMDERAQHAQMVESYSIMESKLHLSMEEQSSLDNTMRELKAELRRKERELKGAQKEISDLQTQIAVLLKECTDIHERQGVGKKLLQLGSNLEDFVRRGSETTASDSVISDRLLTFKDIHGMVEHNSQLRALVRSLAEQNEQRERELKENFDMELKKRTEEATRKVAIVLKKSEEQIEIIESLQGTVGMYKRLYEEELKSRYNINRTSGVLLSASDDSGDDMRKLLERSQEEIQKTRGETAERLKFLEENLDKAKREANDIRSERDRLIVEATYGREQLQTIVRESENQRKEMDAILARNVEFSQTITNYQRKLRENAQCVEKAEENARRLSIEVSVLEREKVLISNAEKGASQEVTSLSDRVHRLQAVLDNIHIVEEARESIRVAEKKKLEEEVNRMQREWAEAKREVEMERAYARRCTEERDQAVKQALDRVDCISKELANALRSVSETEIRANVAEARCIELEASLKKADDKVLASLTGNKKVSMEKDTVSDPDVEAHALLHLAREEIECLKEDLDASKAHVEQYKKIAQANEDALKQMEDAHTYFKAEAERTKDVLESELSTFKRRHEEIEEAAIEKEKSAETLTAEKDRALNDAVKELTALKASEASKMASLEQAEERIKTLKKDVEKQHQLWRSAQDNYERQVLLQADTIRELTSTSERLSILEKEVVGLRRESETARAELESSKVALEMEKSCLVAEKVDIEKKLKELDEQNKILLDRLEAMHVTMVEHERKAGEVAGGPVPAGQGESDFQNVIRYLRRSKETADTEISLLKQERVRLQKQLEASIRSSEDVQNYLHREQENVRASICTEEEFRSLQAQVREMNLLRESNAELREENKQNYEECRSSREKAQKAFVEMEILRQALREKEIELDASGKDIEIQKAEILRWQSRVSQLLEKYKTIDVDDYQKLKCNFTEIQEELKASITELEAMRKEAEKRQERLLKLEQEASSKDKKVAELEKRVQELMQSEASSKTDVEKFKKQVAFLKRKVETLTKEKEDISKERDAYSKQIEDLKANAGKRSMQEPVVQHEQVQKETENLLKEKETRIQSLERTLEREREELRKEKAKRQKDQKVYVDIVQKAQQERQKYMEEINSLKKEKDQYLEKMDAKKTGRRLIRPKIEPLNQQETQTEPSEVMEVNLDGTETEPELQEENKAVMSRIEPMEAVSVTTAIILAGSSSDTAIDLPVSNTQDSVTLGVTSLANINGQRKRALLSSQPSSSEVALENEPKVEAPPLNKRPRVVDIKPLMLEPENAAPAISDGAIIAESVKAGETEAVDFPPRGMESLEKADHKATVSEIGTVVRTSDIHVTSNITEFPKDVMGCTETPAPKRPRITRPDTLISQQPQTVGERGGSEEQKGKQDESSEPEQSESRIGKKPMEDNIVEEGHKPEERIESGRHVSDGLYPPTLFNDTVAHSDEQYPMHGDIEEPMTPDTGLVTELMETDPAESLLVVELNSIADGAGTATIVPISSELPISEDENRDSTTDDKMFVMEGGSEAIVDDGALGTHTDVEEGEIQADTTEQIAELEATLILGTHEDAKENWNEDEPDRVTEIMSPEDAQLSNETDVTEKHETSSTTTEPSHKLEDATTVPVASQMEEQKVDAAEVLHKESDPAQVTTRQSIKNATTIVLAERARERALIRRSGISPPSPGARGRGRGVKASSKKSVGLQRSRPVSSETPPPGADNEEEKGSQAPTRASVPRRNGSQPTSTSSKSDVLRDEQD